MVIALTINGSTLQWQIFFEAYAGSSSGKGILSLDSLGKVYIMVKKFNIILLATALLFGASLHSKVSLLEEDDAAIDLGLKLATTTSRDRNAALLNKDVDEDNLFASKISFDGVLDVTTPTITAKLNPRSKAVFGNNKTIKTSSAQPKDSGGFIPDAHNHTVNLPAVWLREAWIETDLTALFNGNFPSHKFTIGSFPFSLGRGIALGDVYAFNPASLGFYSDGTVDQYAYGAKLSGDLFENYDVSYDIYGAILQNNSTSIDETLAQTQSQALNATSKARGAGAVNWLMAGRLNIVPFETTTSKLRLEPYVLHNSAPEQTIEFFADAKSKLTTTGFAFDFNKGRFELGFDGAMNFGEQNVRGWDRNVVKRINRGGVATYVYSDVYTVNPNVVSVGNADKAVYDPASSSIQAAINSATRDTTNGAAIAGTTYYNGLSRFRPAYTNKYQGYMAVADMGYWILQDKLRIATTAGIASGDINPNANLADPLSAKVDGTYDGFVSLQELYAGNMVKSVFVMGGAKKLVRPLSAPNTGNKFSPTIDSFSNLVFSGTGLTYKNTLNGRKIAINPNVLTYWEHVAGNKFDINTGLTTSEKASKNLGVEFNVITKINLSEDLVFDCMFAMFRPGQHYTDVKGQPFNAAQRAVVDSYDPTSIVDNLPILWDETAYSFATGLTYSF